MSVICGLSAWWLAVIAVYVFNGVMDYPEDRLNGSVRPIATGRLPRGAAVWISVSAAAISVVLSMLVPCLSPWIAAYLLLGAWYSAPPQLAAKRHSGSAGLAIFGLGWSSYAAGISAVGDWYSPEAVVFGLAGAGWMSVVGNLIKDLSDADGDAAAGRRTLAVLYGARFGHACAAAGGMLVGTASILASIYMAPAVLPGTLSLWVGAGFLVVQHRLGTGFLSTDRTARRGGYRVFMRTQYIANLTVLAGAIWRHL